jgi:flagellar biogenesis protein FliO
MDPAPSYEVSLLRVVVTLAVLAFGAWWVTRVARRGAFHARQGAIEVLDRVALDHRHVLYLVRVAGRSFLLGVGGDTLTTLATFDEPSSEAMAPSKDTGESSHTGASVAGRPPA